MVKLKTSRALDGFVGFFLGLGAPAGYLLFRMLAAQEAHFNWIRQEIETHPSFYGYMTVTTPIVFAIFGSTLGFFRDQLFKQNVHLERLAKKLERQSMTDDITALYNHRHILVEVEREVERANRYGRTLSAMMIDIDDFKKINDEHGHLAGDKVLQEVAEVLMQSIRKVDILGRYGGDEFLVILPETDTQMSRTVAERIQRNIRRHSFRVKESPVGVTVSIGLFSFSESQKITIETFIDQTDQVLLQAKRMGKDRILSAG